MRRLVFRIPFSFPRSLSIMILRNTSEPKRMEDVCG